MVPLRVGLGCPPSLAQSTGTACPPLLLGVLSLRMWRGWTLRAGAPFKATRSRRVGLHPLEQPGPRCPRGLGPVEGCAGSWLAQGVGFASHGGMLPRLPTFSQGWSDKVALLVGLCQAVQYQAGQPWSASYLSELSGNANSSCPGSLGSLLWGERDPRPVGSWAYCLGNHECTPTVSAGQQCSLDHPLAFSLAQDLDLGYCVLVGEIPFPPAL